jgi:hypothetical protein
MAVVPLDRVSDLLFRESAALEQAASDSGHSLRRATRFFCLKRSQRSNSM